MTETLYLDFKPGRPEGDILFDWWHDLHGVPPPVEEDGTPGDSALRTSQPNYRGDRAELRRCADPASVVLTPPYQRLYYRLRNLQGMRPPHEARLATVAGVLAWVRAPHPERFARHMAQPKGDAGSPPRVSELRFRRLLRIGEQAELYPILVRLVRLLDQKADIFSLAQGAYGWNDQVRKRWAFDYYDAVFRQGGTGSAD